MSRLLRWSFVRSLLVFLGIPFAGGSMTVACLSGECARATNDPLRAGSGSGSGSAECSGSGTGSGSGQAGGSGAVGGAGGGKPAAGGAGGT